MIKIFIIMVAFFAGLYFCTNYSALPEGFFSNNCADVLIQKGKELFLFNSKKVEVPGVNPIRFENLEDYVEYLDWQRNAGVYCPVLYLQETYDTQNNQGYRILPDPLNPNAGLPSNAPAHMYQNISGQNSEADKLVDGSKRPPFNSGSYPGYDPDNQYIGLWTHLDELKPKDTRTSFLMQQSTSLKKPPSYKNLKTYQSNSNERSTQNSDSKFIPDTRLTPKRAYVGTYGSKYISKDVWDDPDFTKDKLPDGWEIESSS